MNLYIYKFIFNYIYLYIFTGCNGLIVVILN